MFKNGENWVAVNQQSYFVHKKIIVNLRLKSFMLQTSEA